MSARVFKPILLNEVPKMRSSPSLDAKLAASRGVVKVRRALFQPDPDETRRFLDEELAKIAAVKSERWNFDFISGRPILDSGAHYAWVPMTPVRPLLPQRPVKQLIQAASPNISDLYSPIISSSTPQAQGETAMVIDETSPRKENPNTPRKQLQSKITDFLSVRKRPETTSVTKKLPGSKPRPRKIPRLSTS